MITVARSAILLAPALPAGPVASPDSGYAVPIFNECGVLPKSGVLSKSHISISNPARRLRIEATYLT
jgi:hypothetical protein